MVVYQELSDAQLMVSVARYQDGALSEIYRRYAGAVLGLARRVLRDHRHAEDVTQEVFVRLWQQPDRFDPGRGSLRSYLLTASHARAVELVRSSSARRQRERRTLQIVGAQDSVEQHALQLGEASQLHAALADLPVAEREAIALAYFDGHSYREVAEILAEPEGTIKSRIRSGLRHLRATLLTSGITA